MNDRVFNRGSGTDNRIFIFLLLSVGLMVLPHVKNISFSIFLYFNSLLVWRFCGIWKKSWLPNKYVIVGLTIAGVYLLYNDSRGVFGRDAGTSIFIVALGLKLLEIRQNKDLYLVTALAFVVAASLFLYQQSVVMAVYIVMVTCLLFATLLIITTGVSETSKAIKQSALITMQALPIAIIFFVFFPRLEVPQWLLLPEKRSAISGLSDTLRPGSISKLGFSSDLVFRAKFEGSMPPPQKRYWRGPVFSIFDGANWTETKQRGFVRKLDKVTFTGAPYRYKLMMEPQEARWIYALEMPVSFSGAVVKNGLHQLLNTGDHFKRKEFEITSYLNFNTGRLTDTEYYDNIQLPYEPFPEIKKLVNNLQGGNDSAVNLIRAIFKYFKKNGFEYTLNPPILKDNPIETFLFRAKRGFCGHYATAFVYLLRVAKIPARVVAGYQGGEENKAGKFVEVRQSDAHAWAEVWIKGKGWVRVDPTSAVAPDEFEQQWGEEISTTNAYAKQQAEERGVKAWIKHLKDVWGNIDYQWQQSIINYKGSTQADFLSHLGINNTKDMLKWLLALTTIMFLLIGWYLLRKQRQTTDRILLLYQEFCRKLGRLGLMKNIGETENSFASRVIKKQPDLEQSIALITNSYIKIRYGKEWSEKDYKQLKKYVKNLKVSKKDSS